MHDVIHLDHAASTPVRPEVVRLLADVVGRVEGNPMSAHEPGRAARTVLEESRERVAEALGRSPHEVVFTSGATEADQLAVVGLARAAAAAGRRHVVCGGVEHAAVRDALGWLARRGEVSVTTVAPDGVAPIAPDAVSCALRPDTGVVVVTAADGEVGVVQAPDVADAALARGLPVHRDAAQAVATGVVPRTGSLAVSGHKLGGPAGIGAAVLPRDWAVEPLVPGPGQERGLRSGTPPAALAAAFALAVELAVAGAPAHAARARALTAALAAGLGAIEGVTVTLPRADDPARLATHVHATVAGVAGEALVMALDGVGVAGARRVRPGRRCGAALLGGLADDPGGGGRRRRADRRGRHAPAGRGRGVPVSERVLVALSGGVDSAVAAALLVEQGHDVAGVHLRLADVPPATPGRGCCGLDDAQDARRTAQVLGIPFHVWDLRDVFRREVQEPFAAGYAAGTTPNPCVACNARVKVAAVLRRAVAVGYDALATGHHARVVVADGRPRLRRAVDRRKDQSYVLHVHGPDELARLRTPVGALTKAEVRAAAAARGLRVAAKPDSYDVCFVPDGDTAGYLADELPASPGPVVDLDGTVLGRHDGAWRFTVGQRRGLGIDHHESRFVVDVDAARARVVVGPRAALATSWLELADVVWQAGGPPDGVVGVQVRAHGAVHRGAVADVSAGRTGVDGVRVEVEVPFHGVALGQSCVLYDVADEEVLGGGRVVAAERPVLPVA